MVDFRFTSRWAFQALRTFCHLINQTVSDGLIRFDSNQYVSAYVVPQNSFESEIESLIGQFRSSLTNSFLLSLEMIRDTTQANTLVSALATNYYLKKDDIGNRVQVYSPNYVDCSCDFSFSCIFRSSIYDSPNPNPTSLFDVPNFYTGCYVIESLLQSTLECFYDKQCFDLILSYFKLSSLVNVTMLNASLSSKYSMNSTIKELLNNLMIEQWNTPINFENYYNECQPIQCTYTSEANNGAIYIVTTLFGIAGGLITVLKLIVPRLVKFLRKKKEQRQAATEEVAAPNNIRHLFTKSKHYILTYSVFPSIPPSTDEYELRTQRISTRLFIIFFFISLMILLLYTSLIKDTKIVNVEAPSLAQYTHLNSTYTLKCPCSKISINYGKFLHVEYTLHQVCSSIFVDQTWITYLAYWKGREFYGHDFRRIGLYAFQALKIFCNLINHTISDGLIQFNSSQYISASVLHQNLFESETKTLVDQFRTSLTNNFVLSLAVIRNTIQANALFSALQTNYISVLINSKTPLTFSKLVYENCSCGTSSTCYVPCDIYDYPNETRLFNVSRFYCGCYVVESLLRSTLECFYDQQCVDKLQSYLPLSSLVNARALDVSLPSKYSMNSSIKELVDNLMIEQWNVSSNFESYYNECLPAHCTYKIKLNNEMIYIVTTLFGIAGGLITVLKFIVPQLVKLVRKKRRRQQQQQPITGIDSGRHATTLRQKSKYYLNNLNFFALVPPSTDQNELHTQRISTRIFIIIFATSLAILLLYNSLIKVSNTLTVEAPPFKQYAHLNSTYSSTLTCPCSNISINYGKFLHIDYTLHQVCTSNFVGQSWIYYLDKEAEKEVSLNEFYRTGSSMFQALRAFCHLINQTISDSLPRFYSNQYISASVVSQNSFEAGTKSLIDKFRLSLTSSFLLSLSMIRDTTHANALLSAQITNYVLMLSEVDNVHLAGRPISYNNCSCALSSACTAPSHIYDRSNGIRSFIVPGFYVGCYVIESLLQSTLECFYDKQCFDQILSYFKLSSLVNVTVLNASLSSKYSMNSTIKELLNNLMIEQWNTPIIFENYYNECQPIQCTYTFEANNGAIYIVTTLFGIAGGLITVLKLIVPRSVNIIVHFIRKQRTRVVPDISVVET